MRPTDPPLALETPAPTHSLNAVLDEVPPSQREAKGEGNDWGSGKIIGLVLGMISALALALALGAGVCFCYRKRVQICRTGFGQTSNDPEQAGTL